MARNICDDLAAVTDKLADIKDDLENDEYEPESSLPLEFEEIASLVEELRQMVGQWVFANLPREKQKAALR